MAEESVLDALIQSAGRVLLRVVFVFEPLAPTAITLLMNQRLGRFKESGAITDFKTKSKRLGKFHYIIEVDLGVTGMQAVHILSNVFPSQFNRLRRWFHE